MQGMGNHGSGYSDLDSKIIALAKCNAQEALHTIIAKFAQLSDKSAFSHVRSCAMALEALGGESAKKALYDFMLKEKIMGS